MEAADIQNPEILGKVPAQQVGWEPESDGKVVLLVPKFRQRHLARWILPLLAKPTVRVHLDEVGSSVWKICDGFRTVGEICQSISEERGGDPSDWSERVIRFLRQLERERFLRLDQPGTRPNPCPDD